MTGKPRGDGSFVKEIRDLIKHVEALRRDPGCPFSEREVATAREALRALDSLTAEQRAAIAALLRNPERINTLTESLRVYENLRGFGRVARWLSIALGVFLLLMSQSQVFADLMARVWGWFK